MRLHEVDPFSESYWNLLQTLGWIYLGDRGFVAECSDLVTEPRTFFSLQTLPDGRRELVETSAGPVGIFHLGTTAAWNGGSAVRSFAEAERELLEAIASERLEAWGLPNGQGTHTKILPIDATELRVVEHRSDGRGVSLAPKDFCSIGAVTWTRVRFKRESVLAIWPDPLAHPDMRALPAAPSLFCPLENEHTGYVNQWQALDWIQRTRCEHLSQERGSQKSLAELDAERLYRKALQEAVIVAHGRRRNAAEYAPMPTTFWINACIDRAWALRPLPDEDVRESSSPNPQDWPDVSHGGWFIMLSKSDVLACWPEAGLPRSAPPSRPAKVHAAMEGLRRIFPPAGIRPAGVREKAALKLLQQELRDSGLSISTMKRAHRELKTESSKGSEL